MAAGNWIAFDSFKEYMGDNTIDMDGDTFKIQLHNTTWTPSLSADLVRADLSNELSTADGYTAGGATLGSVTWSKSGSTVTFDAADPAWTITGSGITIRYAVIYSDTAANDELVAYCDLYGANQAIPAGTFTITLNASGIITLSGAES